MCAYFKYDNLNFELIASLENGNNDKFYTFPTKRKKRKKSMHLQVILKK